VQEHRAFCLVSFCGALAGAFGSTSGRQLERPTLRSRSGASSFVLAAIAHYTASATVLERVGRSTADQLEPGILAFTTTAGQEGAARGGL
jgi:hypothetical protein